MFRIASTRCWENISHANGDVGASLLESGCTAVVEF